MRTISAGRTGSVNRSWTPTGPRELDEELQFHLPEGAAVVLGP